MASIAAKEVAKEVIQNVRKGVRPVLGKIIPKHGYAPSIATHPKKVTGTKSYQEEIAPVVDGLVKERDRAIQAMSTKDLDEVAYDKLSKVIDELTKNIQLLTGGRTETFGIEGLREEISNLIGDVSNS